MKVGNRRCQCAECKEYFNSVFAFERHRVGKYMPDERRCLTDDEMRDKGMDKNPDGYWVSAKYEGYK